MALFEPLNERDRHPSPPQKERNNRADADFVRRTRIERILSALPPITTEERTFGIGSSVPNSDLRKI
jgi:hypothetical protein